MNKKGYFFSLTVLLILILVYVYFSTYSDPGFSRQSIVLEQRLQEINRVINLVEKDAEAGLRIAGFRTVLDLEHNVSTSGSINTEDFQGVVGELLINGSINGVSQSYTQGNSLNDWEDSIVLLFSNMGLAASFSGSGASLSQSSPWVIVASYESTLFVSDPFSKSNWSKHVVADANLLVTQFFDPLFSIHTNARRKITRIPQEADISDLTLIIDNEYYVESNLSPSFLQRFQNFQDLGVNDFEGVGIESLVNRSVDYIPVFPRPIIDSLYFTDEGSPCESEGYLLAVGFNNTYNVPCNIIVLP